VQAVWFKTLKSSFTIPVPKLVVILRSLK